MDSVIFSCRWNQKVDFKWEYQILSGLTQERQREIQRKMCKEDRSLSLLGEALLRYGIAQVFAQDCQNWVRKYGTHGKPFWTNHPEIEFNLSHSGDMVLCALGNMPVGVDIQKQRSIKESLVRRVLSSEEEEMYRLSSDPKDFFYQVWALKESLLKWSGQGITTCLKKISCYPYGRQIHTNQSDCYPFLLSSPTGYQAAFCSSINHKPTLYPIDLEELKKSL